jgi:hypothetical protein
MEVATLRSRAGNLFSMGPDWIDPDRAYDLPSEGLGHIWTFGLAVSSPQGMWSALRTFGSANGAGAT